MKLLAGLLLAASMLAPPASFAQTTGAPADQEALRLVLAKRYVAASERYAVTSATYEKQLKSFWRLCSDETCQTDLDSAIAETLASLREPYELQSARMLATHLTQRELQAALEFIESPAGRAIVRAQQAMSGDLAAIGDSLLLGVFKGTSTRFCPKQPKICGGAAQDFAPPARHGVDAR